MKFNILLLALPLLGTMACGNSNKDDANDAAGTGSPLLAREVVGVHMLSADTNYDFPLGLNEEIVANTFRVAEGEEITMHDHPNGGEYHWGGNRVAVYFGGPKPFPSIYHAEYMFDKLYQPSVVRAIEAQPERAPQTGPQPQGTGGEVPPVMDKSPRMDNAAANDSSTSVNDESAAATRYTTTARTEGRFQAMPEVGDKAVWEPAANALHILYNNHLLHIQIKAPGTAAQHQQQAAQLAKVVMDRLKNGEV